MKLSTKGFKLPSKPKIVLTEKKSTIVVVILGAIAGGLKTVIEGARENARIEAAVDRKLAERDAEEN